MKFWDMLQTSATNLWKRKLRSILTIMGVVIGVASIVTMVSLGLGLSKSMMEEYESYGSITRITVNAPFGGSSSSSGDELKLDDALIADLSNMEHVEHVYPVLQCNVMSVYGAYSAYITIMGMPLEAIEDMGFEIGAGELPNSNQDDLEFFYGNKVAMSYGNQKAGTDYWSTGVIPDIDYMNGPMFTIFDTDAYYASQTTGSETAPPKKYMIPTSGVQMESEDYTDGSWNVYCDIDKLKAKLKQIFKKKPIPGQPTTKKGKPYPEIYYNQIYVDVDDMDNVSAIQTYIEGLGYQAYSNSEWISSAMNSMNYVQMVLGGIGAVSLLVAAIGIANTMMMSIYERTKEIGVMKVLGCALENIRMMFLLEAAMIGFIGGMAGVTLSLIISKIINYVSQGSDIMGFSGGSGGLSRIPFWLILLSVIFAIFISMIAGFMPAQKAMKLSPLAAIRNE